MRFLLRLVITAVALWVATRIVPGISHSGGALALLGVAVVFGVVNAFIGGLVKLFTLPITIVTLGLFALVINALLLWLTGAVSGSLGLGFHVAGFVPAFWGALVISVTRAVLDLFVREATPRD
ncbi:MAG TPA: phage holin family protein [Myxococcaceae bacterium]|jgi:putative membrane protein|nr:phage holin family protein [Myxococcaceae bacterium]